MQSYWYSEEKILMGRDPSTIDIISLIVCIINMITSGFMGEWMGVLGWFVGSVSLARILAYQYELAGNYK